MKALRRFLSRLGELVTGRRIEADLDTELRSHLDLLADEYLRRGLSPSEARAAARRDFGGLDQTKEAVRDRRGFRVFETVRRDLRMGGRLLLRSPGFTMAAVLTLALGIGANTAIFSLVNAVILRPLPYTQPDRLVSLWEGRVGQPPANEVSHGAPLGGSADANRLPVAPANLPDYQRASGFAGLAGVSLISLNLTGAGTPASLPGEAVTWNYFPVLGVRPVIGRLFHQDDDRPGAPHVVLLSAALWHERFGSNPTILGRAIVLDGRSYQVVGVMPARFTPVTQFGRADRVSFWIPAAYPADLLAHHGDHEVAVVGRLAPGASLAAAQSELTGISEDLARQFPDSNSTMRAFISPLRQDLVRNVRASFVILVATVGVILLIACVNVANLLLVRAVGRRREMAVRVALGASRARVLSSLVTESLVLAALAAAAGIGLAVVTQRMLVATAPAGIPRLASAALDWPVLAFAVGLALVTGLGFGVLPAWQAGRARPVEALRTSEHVVAGTWVMTWRNVLMAAEIALSMILLTGAGLMLRSLIVLHGVPLGFAPDHVLAMSVNLPPAHYPTGDERFAFFDALATRVAALPGVQSVGYANHLPLRGGWETGIMIDGVPAPGDGYVDAACQAVSPGYFDTLDIPLLRGRLLTAADTRTSEPVAVVSEAFSRVLLGGAGPIGRRFRRGQDQPWITVVGVVRDIRRDGPSRALMPQIFLPAAQTALYPVHLSDLAVRTEGDPTVLVATLRRAVLALDKDQPVTRVRTLDATLSAGGAERRFETLLFVLFAGLALVLAVVGVFGVVRYAVSQRTPEIGVRMALGADGPRIIGWLLGRTVWLVLAGAAIGLLASAVLSRFVAGLLFGVAPTDAATYGAAAAGLVILALATSAVAAHAATRIDPIVALRAE